MSIKGFRFSLETPLKIKIIHKTQLEAELIDARNKMNAGKRQLDKLQNEELELYSKLTTLVSKGINVQELKARRTYLGYLVERINSQKLENEKLRNKYKDIQNALTKLLNEINQLEDLKDEKLKEFLKEIEVQEQKELEERINYDSSVQGGMMYG